MEFLNQFTQESWSLTVTMAPWLILGFLAAGVLTRLVPIRLIERHLAGKSAASVFKSVLIGAPLPLCSCGVIPVAASLRKQGASKGAVAAFTASTPQTGVDSIAATYSLMGGLFTIARIIADVVSGIAVGLIINLMGETPAAVREPRTGGAAASQLPEAGNGAGAVCCCGGRRETLFAMAGGDSAGSAGRSGDHPSSAVAGTAPEVPEGSPCETEESCCVGREGQSRARGVEEGEGADSCCADDLSGPRSEGSGRRNWRAEAGLILREGFVVLPRDLAKYLVIGILLGALLSVLLPANALGEYLGHPLLSYAAVTLVAVPLYVCATGSIPIAFGLIHAGLSPGAAIVFLVAGPATNTATVATLWRMIGARETILYVVVLVVTAWLVGLAFDQFVPATALAMTHAHETALTGGWLGEASAVLLVAVVMLALVPKRWLPACITGVQKGGNEASSCCAGQEGSG